MKKDFQPKPLKSLFERNNTWAEIMQTTKLREIEIEVVTKMLACGTTMRHMVGASIYSRVLRLVVAENDCGNSENWANKVQEKIDLIFD